MVKSHNVLATVRGIKYISQTAVTKQWAAKWPFIANAVFRIVQNHGE